MPTLSLTKKKRRERRRRRRSSNKNRRKSKRTSRYRRQSKEGGKGAGGPAEVRGGRRIIADIRPHVLFLYYKAYCIHYRQE